MVTADDTGATPPSGCCAWCGRRARRAVALSHPYLTMCARDAMGAAVPWPLLRMALGTGEVRLPVEGGTRVLGLGVVVVVAEAVPRDGRHLVVVHLVVGAVRRRPALRDTGDHVAERLAALDKLAHLRLDAGGEAVFELDHEVVQLVHLLHPQDDLVAEVGARLVRHGRLVAVVRRRHPRLLILELAHLAELARRRAAPDLALAHVRVGEQDGAREHVVERAAGDALHDGRAVADAVERAEAARLDVAVGLDHGVHADLDDALGHLQRLVRVELLLALVVVQRRRRVSDDGAVLHDLATLLDDDLVGVRAQRAALHDRRAEANEDVADEVRGLAEVLDRGLADALAVVRGLLAELQRDEHAVHADGLQVVVVQDLAQARRLLDRAVLTVDERVDRAVETLLRLGAELDAHGGVARVLRVLHVTVAIAHVGQGVTTVHQHVLLRQLLEGAHPAPAAVVEHGGAEHEVRVRLADRVGGGVVVATDGAAAADGGRRGRGGRREAAGEHRGRTTRWWCWLRGVCPGTRAWAADEDAESC
mmetsp:Transcript_37842/g.116929  ORF Transcript_37842/g.116929 Transcript_37842/m.116929 type:complete len:535 (-) Transcript_37842:62-1666(-)